MKRNIILIIFIILLVPLYLYPFISNKKKYSYFENRPLTNEISFKVENYINKSFQDSIDNYLSDKFYKSQGVRLKYNRYFNYLDKLGINDIFCKNNYIRVSDKSYLFDCDNYLVKDPITKDIANGYLEDKIDMYNYINKKYKVYYYFINDSTTYDFINNKYSVDFADVLKENFKGNFKVKSFKINSYEDYKKKYYRSDHHWNNYGSYIGYKDLVDFISPGDNYIKVENIYLFDSYKFYGSYAKEARTLDIYDKFEAYTFNVPKFKLTINEDENFNVYGGKNSIISNYGNNSFIEFDNMYGVFYGYDYGELLYDFNNPKKDNLLILASSFSNPINELIASHFNKTYIVDIRHYKNDVGKDFDIDKYIKDNKIDKILVLGNSSYYRTDEFNFEVGD